ncbi:hypothetical protein [Candidatus Endomicrobiellum devescovinae]|uniref:hypothetical protein n=1 Tax=Candidatus Endomicrobiellum devescovinae TaxID=3242322 RepID=UPI002821B60B|nr:hypothetical protein [Endomicrobium sp.]
MNLKRVRLKKSLRIVLNMFIILTTLNVQNAQSSWFSDFFGGVFTVLTAPIAIFCPNNPTFRKNTPWVKKEWEEEHVESFEEKKAKQRKHQYKIYKEEHVKNKWTGNKVFNDKNKEENTEEESQIKRILLLLNSLITRINNLEKESINPPKTSTYNFKNIPQVYEDTEKLNTYLASQVEINNIVSSEFFLTLVKFAAEKIATGSIPYLKLVLTAVGCIYVKVRMSPKISKEAADYFLDRPIEIIWNISSSLFNRCKEFFHNLFVEVENKSDSKTQKFSMFQRRIA